MFLVSYSPLWLPSKLRDMTSSSQSPASSGDSALIPGIDSASTLTKDDAPARTTPGLRPADLVKAAESYLPNMLTDLERVITCETPSSDKEAVRTGAEDFARLLEERLGEKPEIIVNDDTSHIRLRFGSGAPRVVLINHQDTVWPHGTLKRLPFSTDDGILRGPGSFDMLTGAVMSVYACRLLLDAAGNDANPHTVLGGLSMLITGDEEIGSTTSSDLIRAEAAKAQAVFVMEASAGGALKVARKGTSDYRVQVTGKASHAGLEPEKGINAGLELAHQMTVIAGLSDPDLGTTVTPTMFGGGTTANTVPAEAHCAVDVRCPSAEEAQRVDAAMHNLTPVIAGARIEVTGGINRPPMERSAAERLFARAQAVAESIGIEPLKGVEVGGASDGNFTAGDGIPTLDGLGAVGDGAHADHEHALIEFIPPRTALLAGLIADHLGAGGDTN